MRLVENYLATWNAADEELRRALLKEHWSERAVYADPLVEAVGHAEIAQVIDGVRKQFPGFHFTSVGEPDAHGRLSRFRWGLGPAGEEPIVIGFDVVVADDRGFIQDVYGFLDRVPG
ncbi:nuclear transport factor 2 family protein [Agromyces silvae]|uniref:nuclear transport factor 2 family protein n=1 Tax=Agromyces silvae TaxID=3388266 RepID=UPI00280C0727|nr:nuclear transport factor 2 family protein [Agromyces protaetiae]